MRIRRDRQSPELVEKILKGRLESKLLKLRMINEQTGCWLFTGPIRNKRYGYTTYKAKSYGVHQLSAYLYLNYVLNSELQVNHNLECPHKHCFNPTHLYVGTQKDNMLDRVSQLTELACGHSKSNLYVYTSKDGKVYKWCRECRRRQRHNHHLKTSS